MAEIANTAWYRQGTVSMTDGSTTVTGVGTNWTTAGINPGATLRIDNRFYAYEVKNVISDTQIELATPYYGGNVSAASYSIDRNFQSTTNAKLAADVTSVVRLYENVRDGTLSTIEGKSAYEVAVANGFKGTASEWLESLKGAGDYSDIVNKLEPITYHNAGAHNSIFRGKNLGTSITAAQYSEIHNGTFRDIYIGDEWSLPIDGTTHAIVVSLGERDNNGKGAILWLQNGAWTFPFNDTATAEGGFLASKMYTETMPGILAKVETVIDPSYIAGIFDQISDSIDDNGDVNHRTRVDNIRIFLPCANNLLVTGNYAGKDHYKVIANAAYGTMGGITWPYALFKYTPYAGAVIWLSSNFDKLTWHILYSTSNRVDATSASNTTVNCWPYIIIR